MIFKEDYYDPTKPLDSGWPMGKYNRAKPKRIIVYKGVLGSYIDHEPCFGEQRKLLYIARLLRWSEGMDLEHLVERFWGIYEERWTAGVLRTYGRDFVLTLFKLVWMFIRFNGGTNVDKLYEHYIKEHGSFTGNL